MPFIITPQRPYHVYVEAGPGGAMAHVAELPGCFATGPNARQAVSAAPGAITNFLVWLKSHREPLVPEAHVARPTMLDISVVEVQLGGAPLQAGSKAALLPLDKVAWDDYKLERTLRWLSYSRADLLAAVQGLDEAALKARKVGVERTLWSTLRHVADAEFGYIVRVAGPPEGKEVVVTDERPADVRERLYAVRDLFVRRVRAFPAERRAEVLFAPWAARPDEPWTLAKAVRRALEHEREHLLEVL